MIIMRSGADRPQRSAEGADRDSADGSAPIGVAATGRRRSGHVGPASGGSGSAGLCGAMMAGLGVAGGCLSTRGKLRVGNDL